MTTWDDTTEARSALQKIFPVMVKCYQEFGGDDAVFSAMELLDPDERLSPIQKNHLICSALYAVMTGAEEADECHPYSEGGYGLLGAIGAFVALAAWKTEKELGLPEDTISRPEWVDVAEDA